MLFSKRVVVRKETNGRREEKGVGCYISVYSEIEYAVRKHSMKKLDLDWDSVVLASDDTPTDRPQIHSLTV